MQTKNGVCVCAAGDFGLGTFDQSIAVCVCSWKCKTNTYTHPGTQGFWGGKWAQGGMAHIICVEGNFKIPLVAVAAATTSQQRVDAHGSTLWTLSRER